VVFVAEEFLKDCGSTLEGAQRAIQGFGNVGWFVAMLAHRLGAKIIAISDASGGIAYSQGLDIPALAEFALLRRPLKEYEGDQVSHVSNEQVLLMPADILVPAALGGVLTPELHAMSNRRPSSKPPTRLPIVKPMKSSINEAFP
jgi:glutamate dehydrogenase (NAD(P)+)